ncbi:MAG: Ig-like domain-containing protein, partial [Campylobacterales bacterium]|nr:Ig-like domain-containing protein [Campylobacterales bacterium]
FIQDIVGVDRQDTSNDSVLKIATLLQSLDSDPSTDEIEIEKTDFDKFKSSDGIKKEISQMTDEEVEKTIKSKGITPKTKEEVKKHLQNSQKQFKVVVDNTAPSLLSTSIKNGASDINIVPSIKLTFSEDIPKTKQMKENFRLKNTNGGFIGLNIDQKGSIITITPKKALA